MKLSGFKESYEFYSGKSSDVARQLSFSGIALVWIFRGNDGVAVPSDLVLPAVLFALSLATDLMHYVFGTVIWGSFHRYHERRLDDPEADPELHAPPVLNWPGNFLFVSKLVVVILGYAALLEALTSRLVAN